MLLSLDAGTLVAQIASGAPVTYWQDNSSYNNSAAAGSGGAPTLTANAIGGRPAVRFDGVDDYLRLPSGFQDFTAGMSVYIVLKPTVLRFGFKLLALGNGANQQNIGFGRAGSGQGYQYFTDHSSGAVGWFNTDGGIVAGEAALVSVIQEAGSANSQSYAEVSKNGEPLFGQNVWVPPVTSRGTNYIGKSYWSDGLFQGDIAEFVLYNRKLSAQEQLAVRGYFAQKYGLPVQ
jgi:hypothetical protein